MDSDSDGRSSDFFYKQANEHYEKRDYEGAIGLYSDAIALDHGIYKYFFNRGLAEACLKRYDDALEDFHEVVKIKEDSAEGHYMIGLCFERKKMICKAISEYDKALKLKPDFKEAQDRKGHCESKRRQRPHNQATKKSACDSAVGELVKSLEEDGTISNVLTVLQKLGKTDDPLLTPQRRTISAKAEVPPRGEVVCGLKEFKDTIEKTIITPLMFSNHPIYQVPIAQTSKGIILHGPPGCGKTLSVTKLAKENGIELVEVVISEVLNMWVGESEKRITKVFNSAKEIARNGRPVILFIDELEALGFNPSMTAESDEQSWCRQLIATFRMLFNDIQNIPNLIVIGATNRVWSVDEALKRPGRLGSAIIYCPPPDEPTREELFRHYSRDTPGHESLDFRKLAEKAQWYSGDDIRCICRDAHFEIAMRIVKGQHSAHATTEDFLRLIKGRSSQVITWLRQTAQAYREGKIGDNEIEKQLRDDIALFNAYEDHSTFASSDNGTAYA